MPFLICFLLVFGPRTSTVFDIINITCVGLIAYAFVFQKKIDIKAPKDFSKNLIKGASVAVNGVCLTVKKGKTDILEFDVIEEDWEKHENP